MTTYHQANAALSTRVNQSVIGARTLHRPNRSR